MMILTKKNKFKVLLYVDKPIQSLKTFAVHSILFFDLKKACDV